MKKHAYLIMAHDNFEVLEKLLQLIDDERNDIFLHIDKKVINFDFNKLTEICKKSEIFFTSRINVNWGGFSQIKCEIILLKKALSVNKHYDYYHLVSGVDLPIKSQDYIHEFFRLNYGKEFIAIKQVEATSTWWKEVENRIIFYHFFYDFFNWKKNNILSKFIKLINKIILFLQKILKVKRFNNQLYYGPNWFSITETCAKYIIENETWIYKNFKYTKCGDELFLQTLVATNKELYNSIYKYDSTYDCCLRHVDFKRGNPYIFTINDYKELESSPNIFARKFDEKTDKKIIEKISQNILS